MGRALTGAGLSSRCSVKNNLGILVRCAMHLCACDTCACVCVSKSALAMCWRVCSFWVCLSFFGVDNAKAPVVNLFLPGLR